MLLNNGKVLVAGGQNSSGSDLYTAEIYDPQTGQWSYTGSLNTSRRGATLVALADGRALIAGGARGAPDGNRFLASAEIYDPSTGSWSYTGSLSQAREGTQGVRLNDGRVLLVLGEGPWYTFSGSAEIYDPSTGAFAPTGVMGAGYTTFTLTPLLSGKVLSVGGWYPGGSFYSSAKLYTPMTGAWDNTAAMTTARAGHTSTRLVDGRVLVVGGNNSAPNYQRSTELYDPIAAAWSAGPDLQVGRSSHGAVRLPSGQILVVGGIGDPAPTALRSCEVYTPSSNNDDFDAATALTVTENGFAGQILVSDTRSATVAADDPEMGCGIGQNVNTLWYKFSPSFSGSVRFRTYSELDPNSSSDYDTVLAVFTGARGALNRIICNDDADGRIQSEVIFPVSADRAYYVEVAQKGTTPGGGRLSMFYGRYLSASNSVR